MPRGACRFLSGSEYDKHFYSASMNTCRVHAMLGPSTLLLLHILDTLRTLTRWSRRLTHHMVLTHQTHPKQKPVIVLQPPSPSLNWMRYPAFRMALLDRLPSQSANTVVPPRQVPIINMHTQFFFKPVQEPFPVMKQSLSQTHSFTCRDGTIEHCFVVKFAAGGAIEVGPVIDLRRRVGKVEDSTLARDPGFGFDVCA